MKPYADSIQTLIDEFTKLPGIGARAAERLAFHILKMDKDGAMSLAFSIRDVKKNIRHCRVCANLTDKEVCDICTDERRDKSLLCVVEYPRDLTAIEKTDSYNGLYHVLMGRFSPAEEPEGTNLRLQELAARLEDGTVKELIVATNPDTEGDATALFVKQFLNGARVTMTRLARGLPAGGDLQFAGKAILSEAMEGRKEL